MIDEREIVRQAVERLAPPEPSFERLLRRRDRKRRNQRMAAGAVGIAVFAAAVWAVTTGGPLERTRPPADATQDIPGLPEEGAKPSTPARGDLVLHLEGSTDRFRWNNVWVYEDGRVIWFREDLLPRSTGLFEQRVTREGVDFLESEVLSTGLFEQDLALARGVDAPYLSIQVRNGDRIVRLTWAHRLNFRVGEDAPFATPMQAEALESLYDRITDLDSWPAVAWRDREFREFVPYTYSICFRGFPGSVRMSRAVPLLPRSAQELLDAGVMTREEAVPSNGSCSRLTTENARRLAEILDAAGLYRGGLPADELFPDRSSLRSSLGYDLEDPDSGNVIWISFAPGLPHGEATWLGPG